MNIFRPAVLCVTALLLLAGCASRSPAPDYYRLMLPAASAESHLSGFSLVIGPVSIPERLDKDAILRPRNAEKLFSNELNRWSEPLDDALTQELAWYIGGRAPGLEAYAYPWPTGAEPTYQVAVQLSRFETISPTRLELSGTWILTDLRQGESLVSQRFIFSEDIRERSVRELVEAHGRAATRLGDQILERLGEELEETGPSSRFSQGGEE